MIAGLRTRHCSWRVCAAIACHNNTHNGVEAFLYCQLEGAVGDETVTLARQQSTDIFFFSKVNVVPHKTMRIMLQCSVPSFVQ